MSSCAATRLPFSIGGATVFQRAQDEFLQQLSPEERAMYTKVKTSDDLLKGFQTLGRFSTDNSRWAKVFQAVKNCSEKLQPYFDILDVVVQSHPEWAAIAWGAFRLVLKLASNFVGFFEKLSDILLQLAATVPAYEEILQFDVTATSDRFKSSLCNFYVDLFELFKAISRVFTQKSGKLRKTPIVIAQLLWQPLGVRFKNLLERFEFHKRVMLIEIDVLQLRTTRSCLEAQDKERFDNEAFRTESRKYYKLIESVKEHLSLEDRRKLVDGIRIWIDPPSFAETFEKSISLRQPGTAEWIFTVDAFEHWRHSSGNIDKPDNWDKVLWVQGNPGTGKTVLAASSIQKVRQLIEMSMRPLQVVCYFFFEAKKPGKSTRSDALRALLAQILQQCMVDDTVLDFFMFGMSAHREGQLNATYNEMIDLLTALAKHLSCTHLILDGVDECDEPDDFMLDLWRMQECKNVRLLFFSRPNVGFLRRTIPISHSLRLDRASNNADLELYFNWQLRYLQELRLLPSQLAFGSLIPSLLSGADGMFLWARLMMAHLRSPAFSPNMRLSIILKLKMPERLEEMYDRIVNQILSGPRQEQSLARSIFTWLTFGKRPLSDSELHDILKSPEEAEVLDVSGWQSQANHLNYFEYRVVMVCGSLVECRGLEGLLMARCSFIHHSVFEYFWTRCEASNACCNNNSGSIGHFFPATIYGETELATSCLSYLIFRAPAEPLSGHLAQTASAFRVESMLPFLKYAALEWPTHLGAMVSKQRRFSGACLEHFRTKFEILLQLISKFLSRLVPMSWVEALYMFAKTDSKTPSNIQANLFEWTKFASRLLIDYDLTNFQGVLSSLTAFVDDLQALHKMWGDVLSRAPNHIWNDVTAFTHSPFFQQSSALLTKHLPIRGFRCSSSSSRPLSRTSSVDVGTGTCAVLTIWPSIRFEIDNSNNNYVFRDEAASGWTAHYELWNTSLTSPKVFEEWELPLNKDEVMVQLRYFKKTIYQSRDVSSRHKAPYEVGIHFPTSISSKLDCFTVLRTLFIRKPQLDCRDSSRNAKASEWTVIAIPIVHTEGSTLLYDSDSSLTSVKDPKDNHGQSPSPLRHDRTTTFRITIKDNYLIYLGNGGSVKRNKSPDSEVILTTDPKITAEVLDAEHESKVSSDETTYSPVANNYLGHDKDEDEDDHFSSSQFIEELDIDEERDDGSGSDDEANVPEHERMATSIVVFTKASAKEIDGIRLAGYIESLGEDSFISRFDVHPYLPLMVCHCRSDSTDEAKVVIWNFNPAVNGGSHVHARLTWTQIMEESSPCCHTLVSKSKFWVESLQFTTCGRRVIIDYYAANHPEIVSIEETEVYKLSEVQLHVKDPSLLELEATDSISKHLVRMGKYDVHSLSQNQLIPHDSVRSTQLSFHPNSTHTDIELVQSDKSCQTFQPLLSLPRWLDARDINVSTLPQNGQADTHIRILLGKTGRLYSQLTEVEEEAPIAIVQKDLKALAGARKKLARYSTWEYQPPIQLSRKRRRIEAN